MMWRPDLTYMTLSCIILLKKWSLKVYLFKVRVQDDNYIKVKCQSYKYIKDWIKMLFNKSCGLNDKDLHRPCHLVYYYIGIERWIGIEIFNSFLNFLFLFQKFIEWHK